MRGHACASRRATRIRIRDRLGMEEKWLSLGRIGAISTLSPDVRDADDVLAVECFAERFLPRATSSTLSFSRAEVARERHPNELHANFCLIFQSFPYPTGKFPFNVRTVNRYASILDCQSGRLEMIQLRVQAFKNFSFHYVRQLSKVPSHYVDDSFSYNFRLGRFRDLTKYDEFVAIMIAEYYSMKIVKGPIYVVMILIRIRIENRKKERTYMFLLKSVFVTSEGLKVIFIPRYLS